MGSVDTGSMTDVVRSARLDLVALTPELLRVIECGDAERVSEVLGVEVPPEFLPTIPARALLDRLPVELARGRWCSRAIVVRAEGRVVGNIGFLAPPDADGTVRLEYALLESELGRGYASEAVGALQAWAMETGLVRMFRWAV
ncbi:N-acetyltransferase [Pseudonocardiaceae bacterium YIM PH 21723]|nr:N-acetyltransferase [Pseudonocardiaceae bacterium YIM PH 21723]